MISSVWLPDFILNINLIQDATGIWIHTRSIFVLSYNSFCYPFLQVGTAEVPFAMHYKCPAFWQYIPATYGVYNEDTLWGAFIQALSIPFGWKEYSLFLLLTLSISWSLYRVHPTWLQMHLVLFCFFLPSCYLVLLGLTQLFHFVLFWFIRLQQWSYWSSAGEIILNLLRLGGTYMHH